MIKKNCVFTLMFFICCLFCSNCCYAATPGNQDNVYENIYSLSQYTTVQNLLNDSAYAPDSSFVNEFLTDKKYKNKYIVSYCNSGNCEQTSDSRSIGFVGFNDDVSADFQQVDRTLNIHFKGDPSSTVYIFQKSNFLGESGEYSLSMLNNNKTFNMMRCVLPVSNVSNVNQLLPSLILDSAFKNFEKEIKHILTDNFNSIMFFICLIIFSFVLCYYIKKLRRVIK